MEFKLITNSTDLANLAEDWNSLLSESISNSPFLRYEFLNAWWQTRGGGEWNAGELAVIAAWQNGQLLGIAPLFQNADRLLLLGSIEIADYLDLISRPRDLNLFASGLFDFLEQSGPPAWRTLDFYNLLETSPTLPLLKTEATRRGWAFTQETLQPTPYIPLPGDFEAYLSAIDKKQRHEIRRKMRRAAEYEKPVRWYIVTDETMLEAEVNAFLDLMANDPDKAAFLTGAMRAQMHATARAAFRSGWLQLAFLEVGGGKAAGYLNFDYNNRIWVYNSGLDRRFMDISPGWVLLAHLLQWANEHKREEFDFMRGDEDYKYRFGAANRFVVYARIAR